MGIFFFLKTCQPLVLNGNYNGVYWYVMDSIDGMLNPIGKMPKHNRKCNDLMGIVLVLMETIMVSSGK